MYLQLSKREGGKCFGRGVAHCSTPLILPEWCGVIQSILVYVLSPRELKQLSGGFRFALAELWMWMYCRSSHGKAQWDGSSDLAVPLGDFFNPTEGLIETSDGIHLC